MTTDPVEPEDIRPELATVVNVTILVAPLHGPDELGNLTSTRALIDLATEVLGLAPGVRINIFRPSPAGGYVLGANHPHADQDDVYINIEANPSTIEFSPLQLWSRLSRALRGRIELGRYSYLVTINGGNGVRYPRSQSRLDERDAL